VSDRFVWLTLFVLGCYHGINPGMGWLFAVALGLQDRSTIAVVRAVVPIAVGHVISVAIVVLLAVEATAFFPHAIVHRTAAGILIAFGLYRLLRVRHPRWVGMRVGFSGLTLWGFLMASAHGAGLMLLPFVTAAGAAYKAMPMAMPSANIDAPLTGCLMIGMHTLGYFMTMTAVALVVYVKFGVSFLRSAWFNVDLIWSIALFVTGFVTLFT
jgi:hypothetical protein